MKAETSLVYMDEEIMAKIQQDYPKVVAIDAPLSLTPGRIVESLARMNRATYKKN
jgi:predicted nuclease with RNAse H fold